MVWRFKEDYEQPAKWSLWRSRLDVTEFMWWKIYISEDRSIVVIQILQWKGLRGCWMDRCGDLKDGKEGLCREAE